MLGGVGVTGNRSAETRVIMKIGKIELTKEKKIMVISAAAAVIISAVFFLFYAQLNGKLVAKYRECRSIEAKVLNARNVIESAGKIYEERTLPVEKNISQAIDELTKHGKLEGIDFMFINPEELKEEQCSEYKILPIKMKIESTYEQLALLLGSLDELDKGILRIISFDTIPDKKDPEKFITNLTINMYFSKEENEE